jgi:hypothetical protein
MGAHPTAYKTTSHHAMKSQFVSPGPRHWGIFADLCRKANARGHLVPDAYLAALAIESGSEWITTDRGYARFPGLRWRHPLDD